MTKPRLQSARDIAIGIFGAGILGYEFVTQGEPRMIVVTIAVAMIGVPSSLLTKRHIETPEDSPPEELISHGRHAR